jgi:UDP-N-acetylmuramyl pentapeptide synthase
MALLDLTDVKENTFETIKPGKYLVFAQEAKVEDNFNKTGKKLSVKFRIMGGEFDKRFVYTNFNIHNQSAEAQLIGRQQLKNFMSSIGAGDILNDVSELTNKSCLANIKNETKDDKTYPRIIYFEKLDPQQLVATTGEDVIPF